MQEFQIDFAQASIQIGSAFYLNLPFPISSNYSTNTYNAPFNLTIYKCEDPHCFQCDFDLPNLSIGSKMCNTCDKEYELTSNGCVLTSII